MKIEAYCVKCKAKKTMTDPKEGLTKAVRQVVTAAADGANAAHFAEEYLMNNV